MIAYEESSGVGYLDRVNLGGDGMGWWRRLESKLEDEVLKKRVKDYFAGREKERVGLEAEVGKIQKEVRGILWQESSLETRFEDQGAKVEEASEAFYTASKEHLEAESNLARVKADLRDLKRWREDELHKIDDEEEWNLILTEQSFAEKEEGLRLSNNPQFKQAKEVHEVNLVDANSAAFEAVISGVETGRQDNGEESRKRWSDDMDTLRFADMVQHMTADEIGRMIDEHKTAREELKAKRSEDVVRVKKEMAEKRKKIETRYEEDKGGLEKQLEEAEKQDERCEKNMLARLDQLEGEKKELSKIANEKEKRGEEKEALLAWERIVKERAEQAEQGMGETRELLERLSGEGESVGDIVSELSAEVERAERGIQAWHSVTIHAIESIAHKESAYADAAFEIQKRDIASEHHEALVRLKEEAQERLSVKFSISLTDELVVGSDVSLNVVGGMAEEIQVVLAESRKLLELKDLRVKEAEWIWGMKKDIIGEKREESVAWVEREYGRLVNKWREEREKTRFIVEVAKTVFSEEELKQRSSDADSDKEKEKRRSFWNSFWKYVKKK